MERERYGLGIGHILAHNHDPGTCVACAYAKGREDALHEPHYAPGCNGGER